MRQRLQQWWIGLSRRERIATAACATLAGLAVLYLSAIEPAWRTRQRLGPELAELRADAAQVEALRLEARRLKERALRIESPAQAKAVLIKLAAGKDLAGATVRDTGDQRLVLAVRGADAAAWLGCLGEISAELPLRITAARIFRTAPGVVDAEATLTPVGQQWQ